MFALCPCPMGASGGKLVELTPFGGAGSGSDEDRAGPAAASDEPATLADRAKGWLAMGLAPVQAMRDSRQRAADQEERLNALKVGAAMRLLPDGRGEAPRDVHVKLSPDGAMLMWSGQGMSGVMALSAVREVKEVLQQGIFRSGGPVPGQWLLASDDQTVRFEASSDEVKSEWMKAIELASGEQREAKTGRKLLAQQSRRMGLEERKREAERRKAEVLKTCTSGGMKHTAAAMMSRS